MGGGEGADVVWTNTNGGRWGASTNWNPNRVPGPADRALIAADGDYSVRLDVNAAVAGLVVGATSEELVILERVGRPLPHGMVTTVGQRIRIVPPLAALFVAFGVALIADGLRR